MFWLLYHVTSHKNTKRKCTSPISTPRRGYHKSSLYFIPSFFIQTILRHSYLLGVILSLVRTSPTSFTPPGTTLCYFLFPKTLNLSGTRGEGEFVAMVYWSYRGKGFPQKYFFNYFSLRTISVLTSVLCQQSVSTNFVADCRSNGAWYR